MEIYGIPAEIANKIQQADGAIAVYTEDEELAFVILTSCTVTRTMDLATLAIKPEVVAIEYGVTASTQGGEHISKLELDDSSRRGFFYVGESNSIEELAFRSVFHLESQDDINEFYEEVLERVNQITESEYSMSCGTYEAELHSMHVIAVEDILIQDDSIETKALAHQCSNTSLAIAKITFNIILEVD